VRDGTAPALLAKMMAGSFVTSIFLFRKKLAFVFAESPAEPRGRAENPLAVALRL
jgi:hypothetical protein